MEFDFLSAIKQCLYFVHNTKDTILIYLQTQFEVKGLTGQKRIDVLTHQP